MLTFEAHGRARNFIIIYMGHFMQESLAVLPNEC